MTKHFRRFLKSPGRWQQARQLVLLFVEQRRWHPSERQQACQWVFVWRASSWGGSSRAEAQCSAYWKLVGRLYFNVPCLRRIVPMRCNYTRDLSLKNGDPNWARRKTACPNRKVSRFPQDLLSFDEAHFKFMIKSVITKATLLILEVISQIDTDQNRILNSLNASVASVVSRVSSTFPETYSLSSHW